MLDKKQIQEIFLFEVKLGHKASETTCNINKALEPGTANGCTVQWWFKKFSKGDKSLEDENHSAQSSEVDNNQLRRSSKLILLQLHEKLSKNSVSTVLWSFGIWSKLKRWKSSISGCLMRWLKIKKRVILKRHLLLFFATNHFSIGLWRVMKSGFYMITNDDQLSGWTEKKLQSTSQSQTWTQKCPGHCLVVYCPSNPLQLSKSQRHHYNWEVCLADQWDAPKTAMPAASTGQQKEPNSSPWQVWWHVAQPTLQKLKELDYEVLPHTPYSPDLSPTDYHLFKHLDSFWQGKCFHNQQEAEDAFREFTEYQSTDLCTTGISKRTSHWQKCVDCSGSYFD